MVEEGISIVIITQNRAPELKKTLDLLKNQKCTIPYEILIIDQASVDNTNTMCCNLQTPFKYVCLEKNYGVAGGRNKGAELSKYTYMVFLDDDAHFYDNDALEKIFMIMKNSSYDLFAFRILNINGGLYNWPYSEKKKKLMNSNFECAFYIGCGHAIKKEFFEMVNGYSDSLFFWGEETELVMKSIRDTGKGVEYIGGITIIHRVKGNGRNTYDANRFYYQVRNRMFIIKELVPSIFWGYSMYYRLGYFVKGLSNKWLKQYFKGLEDYSKMPLRNSKKLSPKQFLRYLMMQR